MLCQSNKQSTNCSRLRRVAPPPSPPPRKGMCEAQRKVYKGVLMRDIDAVNGSSVGRTAILNIVMQLRKCCNHPYLFPNTEDRNLDPMGEHLVENCGKVRPVRQLYRDVGCSRESVYCGVVPCPTSPVVVEVCSEYSITTCFF